MSRGELLLAGLATAVAWSGTLIVLVALVRATGLLARLATLAEALLRGAAGEDAPRADVREIATGRPHLRLVVDQVGDEVERDVFPPDAA
jgi:hypothetical protein